MTRFTFRLATVRTLILAAAATLALQANLAAPIDTGRPGSPPRDPPLDCTNRDNNICIECGQPDGLLACCSSGGCDIIIGPQPPPPPPQSATGHGFAPIRKGLGSMTYFAR